MGSPSTAPAQSPRHHPNPNPVLAEVTRSGKVESVHRGAIAVAGKDGRIVAQRGDVEQVFYLRSAAKPIQLLPLVECGAADRFGLESRELAVAAASHSASPGQVAAVESLLAKIGLDARALDCGYQEPRNRETLARVNSEASAGRPPDRSSIYNNCSGKHAGMLALAVSMGADPAGYLQPTHPAQARILARTAGIAGIAPDQAHFGVDGCSAPTLALTLAQAAAAFARLAGELKAPGSAASRIRAAMAASSDMLGEPESFNTVLMRTLGPRLIGKLGAEGAFCVAIAEPALGLALKIEDGASRPLGPVVLEALVQIGVIAEDELGPLGGHRRVALKNWRGTPIGEIRPVVSFAAVDPAG